MSGRRLHGRIPIAWALVALLLVSPDIAAQERVLDATVEVRVRTDGRLDVTERIEVRAEGQAVRHGIVRRLPTRVHDARGRRAVTDVDVLDVLRDGRPEPWTRRRTEDAVQLRTGDDRHLPRPSQPVYTLRYRLDRRIRFHEEGDVLELTALRPPGGLQVARGSVTVILPQTVPVAALHADGHAGPPDPSDPGVRVALSSTGAARWTLSRPLQADGELTLRLRFPHGIVAPPTPARRLAWWIGDHAGVLVALAGVLALTLLCVRRWQRNRRRPADTPAPASGTPPPGFSPGGLRYMTRLRYDARCGSADLLASAVADHVGFHRERADAAGTGWRLTRVREGADTLPTMEQRALVRTLLPAPATTLTLDPAHADPLRQALAAHETVLRRRFQPALFHTSGMSLSIAALVALAFAGPAVWLGILGGTLPGTALALTAMLPALLAARALARTPTAEGRRLLARIDGLRTYLSGSGPQAASPAHRTAMNPAHYAALLPYAVALDVEEAWTRTFEGAVGAEAAASAIAAFPWYTGVTVTDAGRFSRSVGRRLEARIAAVSTRRIPPVRFRGGRPAT